MAGRQLQKLLKQDLAENADLDQTSSEDEEEEVEERVGKPFNPFDLLGDDDQEPQEEDSEEEEDEEEQPIKPTSTPPSASKTGSDKQPASTSASHKKKGKQYSTTSVAESSSSTSARKRETSKAREEEDIDLILRELNITSTGATATTGQSASTSSAVAASLNERRLLGIDIKCLRPEEELRRIFGSQVVNASRQDDASSAFAGASRRVRRLAARGLIRRETLKPGTLINPRDTWPRPDDLFTFKCTGTTNEGHASFTYEFEPQYHALQELYEECQATFDPNAIAALLRSHPYHVDGLLTMADLYRSTGEHSYADEMIERCIYVLERTWPPSFLSALAAGTAHVPYNPNNSNLFTALFRYIQSLGRRGLHRTALELSKLLLGLNADDPMGVLMCIDYFAVRSLQYSFLYKFIDQYQCGEQSIALFPNMSYSLALAKWYEQNEKSAGATKKGGKTSVNDSSNALVSSSSSNSSGLADWTAKGLLLRAVLLHPLVVVKVQDKMKEAGISLKPAWSTILSSTFFTSPELSSSSSSSSSNNSNSASLGHLVELFVARQHQLWKAAPIQDFLLEACTTAVAAATDTSGLEHIDDLPEGLTPQDWKCIRQEAFPPTDVNAYRHLRVYEFSDAAGRLPVEELHGMAGAVGAAADEEQLRAAMAEAAAVAAEEIRRGRIQPEELADANPLMVLLRSMLPWVTAGEQPDYTREEEEEDDDDDNTEHVE